MSALFSYVYPPVTVADAESMPDDGNRYEVIDGELFVSTSPNFLHQNLLMRLSVRMFNHLEGSPTGMVISGLGVVFDDFNGVVPDLIYISNEHAEAVQRDGRLKSAPEIAIEILSPGSSNERRDRIVKRQLFSSRGVQEYWIIDPEAKAIEIYLHEQGKFGPPHVLNYSDNLTTPLLPGFSLPLKNLFR